MQTTHGCDESRVEALVTGTLNETEVARCEQHVLTCASCAAQVRALVEARWQLEADARGVVPRTRAARTTLGLLALAASVMVAVAGASVWWLTRGPATPVTSTADARATPAAAAPAEPDAARQRMGRLAAFDPPPYLDLATRAEGVGSSPFDHAMRLYNRRDYRAAAAALAPIAAAEAEALTARLFLGISLLADARPAEALPHLDAVGRAPSAHAGLAHLMVARAHLALGNAEQARAALARAAAGDDAASADEARVLLSRLAEEHEPRP